MKLGRINKNRFMGALVVVGLLRQSEGPGLNPAPSEAMYPEAGTFFTKGLERWPNEVHADLT